MDQQQPTNGSYSNQETTCQEEMASELPQPEKQKDKSPVSTSPAIVLITPEIASSQDPVTLDDIQRICEPQIQEKIASQPPDKQREKSKQCKKSKIQEEDFSPIKTRQQRTRKETVSHTRKYSQEKGKPQDPSPASS